VLWRSLGGDSGISDVNGSIIGLYGHASIALAKAAMLLVIVYSPRIEARKYLRRRNVATADGGHELLRPGWPELVIKSIPMLL
jgi:hypothetical protein